MKTTIEFFNSVTGFGVDDLKDRNFICSATLEDKVLIDFELGVIGEKRNLKKEDVEDLVDIAVMQNNISFSKNYYILFVEGFN